MSLYRCFLRFGLQMDEDVKAYCRVSGFLSLKLDDGTDLPSKPRVFFGFFERIFLILLLDSGGTLFTLQEKGVPVFFVLIPVVDVNLFYRRRAIPRDGRSAVVDSARCPTELTRCPTELTRCPTELARCPTELCTVHCIGWHILNY